MLKKINYRQMKNTYKYTGFLFAFLLCFGATTCSEESYDPNPGEAFLVSVRNVRMIVEGEMYQGKMNENKKDIQFPKIEPGTNLSAVRFRGSFPDDNAQFDSETYDFTIDEAGGATEIKKVITVVNGKRFRDYFVTIRLNTPPPGADFNKAKVYNFSEGRYPEYTADLIARPADMDLNHVLIPVRTTAGRRQSHLLLLEDLKKTPPVFTPIDLNMTGVTGGTFDCNSGRIINGHVYINNLATNLPTSPLRIYHWNTANLDAPPDLIANCGTTSVADQPDGGLAGIRFGDYVSYEINSRGSGTIFAKGNFNSWETIKIGVSGFTTTGTPGYIQMAEDTGLGAAFIPPNKSHWYSWAVFSQVEGQSDEFLLSGWGEGTGRTALMDSKGKVLYHMTAATSGKTLMNSARIFTFNGMRYMVAMNGSSLSIFALRLGETTEEALKAYEEGDVMYQTAAFSVSLGTVTYAAANAAVHAGFVKTDDTLYVIGSAAGNGFVIIEAPKTEETEPGAPDEYFEGLDEKGYI